MATKYDNDLPVFKEKPGKPKDCRTDQLHNQVPGVVKRLLESWSSKSCYEHISSTPIPSKQKIIEIIERTRKILFPGFFTQKRLHPTNLEFHIGSETNELYDEVVEQIHVTIRHDCSRHNRICTNSEILSHELALKFIDTLPEIAEILASDIRATLKGDPATKSPDEVIFCYPGLLATSIYRIAHVLNEIGVPTIPRIMTEHAHSLTGIDIHPGATIGEGFFIDHGTGVVIGETCIIGNNVRLYQGVTLGALSLGPDAGAKMKNKKRHPTIEDNVIIYSNTTILGGETVIGEGATIGGNNWLTESVDPGTRVLVRKPELIYSNKKR